MYGIVDCDNCYVSCERVFRPDLNGVPVVVLSNNDGCVVARSNEAKKMGINVATLYRWKDKYCNICEALKKGREPVDVILEDTAFERATQWKTVKEITKELKFDRESGETRLMVTKEVEKKVPPDSTLLIFLMKSKQIEN